MFHISEKGPSSLSAARGARPRHICAHLKRCVPAVSSCSPASGISLVDCPLQPPPPPPPPPPPFFILHVNLGRQVYILVFKAALFSVKCCVATSNGLADRAFLGFQHGRRIIGGRPRRIWQMCDEFLPSAGVFFFFPFSKFCMHACVRSRGKHKSFLCCPPPLPL